MDAIIPNPYNYLMMTAQYIVAMVLGGTPSLISLMGPTGIIYLILGVDGRHKTCSNPLLFFGQMETGFLAWIFSSSRLSRRQCIRNKLPMASGSDAACTSTGMLSSIVLASSHIYSAELTVYFHCAACSNRSTGNKSASVGKKMARSHSTIDRPLTICVTFGAVFGVLHPNKVRLGILFGIACEGDECTDRR
jgi:hypothetical protein